MVELHEYRGKCATGYSRLKRYRRDCGCNLSYFFWNFPNGYLGVDVFFVISGFVLAPILIEIASETNRAEKYFKMREFIRRRIFRLLPALVVFWSLICLVFVIFADVKDFRIISNQVMLSILQVGNIGSHYLQGSYFSDFSNPWVHTWSLAVEFQLYLLICLIAVLSKNKKSFTLIITLLAMISVILFLTGGQNNNSLWRDYYSPITRVWEVFFGTILFIALHEKQKIKRFNISTPIQMILICIAVFPIAFNKLSITVVTIVLTCILLASHSHNRNGILENKLLIEIGNRSYSIYLVHIPVIYICQRLPIFEKVKDTNYIKLLYLIITILIAHTLYKRIEQKYRQPKLSIVEKRNFVAFTLIAIMSASILHFSSGNIADSMVERDVLPPWINTTGCQIFGNLDKPHVDPCLIFSTNYQKGKVVLLLGDSHAAVYKNALKDIARKSNTKLYASTQYGCPFFVNLEIATSSLGARNCLMHNSSILKWIIRAQPDSIILVSRPGYVLEGFHFTEAQLLDLEMKAVKAIMKLGIDVVRIGPVPERELYVSIMQRYYPALFEPSKFQLSMNQNEYWLKQHQDQKFRFLDVFAKFCKNKCPEKINNEPIYFDSNHLNDYGASIALEGFKLE